MRGFVGAGFTPACLGLERFAIEQKKEAVLLGADHPELPFAPMRGVGEGEKTVTYKSFSTPFRS